MSGSTNKDQKTSGPIAIAVDFQNVPLHTSENGMDYSVIEYTQGYYKIVFHFKKTSLRAMNALGEFFYKKINPWVESLPEANKNVINISASRNPMFRSNWDVLIYPLNSKIRAKQICDQLVLKIKREFGEG